MHEDHPVACTACSSLGSSLGSTLGSTPDSTPGSTLGSTSVNALQLWHSSIATPLTKQSVMTVRSSVEHTTEVFRKHDSLCFAIHKVPQRNPFPLHTQSHSGCCCKQHLAAALSNKPPQHCHPGFTQLALNYQPTVHMPKRLAPPSNVCLCGL